MVNIARSTHRRGLQDILKIHILNKNSYSWISSSMYQNKCILNSIFLMNSWTYPHNTTLGHQDREQGITIYGQLTSNSVLAGMGEDDRKQRKWNRKLFESPLEIPNQVVRDWGVRQNHTLESFPRQSIDRFTNALCQEVAVVPWSYWIIK